MQCPRASGLHVYYHAVIIGPFRCFISWSFLIYANRVTRMSEMRTATWMVLLLFTFSSLAVRMQFTHSHESTCHKSSENCCFSTQLQHRTMLICAAKRTLYTKLPSFNLCLWNHETASRSPDHERGNVTLCVGGGSKLYSGILCERVSTTVWTKCYSQIKSRKAYLCVCFPSVRVRVLY